MFSLHFVHIVRLDLRLRNIMKMNKLFYALSIALLSTTAVQAQQIAKGIVYEDANSNGKIDKNERGLSEVAVSNGVEVVLTNAKGEYSLPVQDDNIIFVIKPAGYSFALDKDNLPQSYYIYKPKGSPALKYEGVAATGKLPKAINFGLQQTAEDAKFTAFVFGDPQAYNLNEIDFFKRGMVDKIADKKAGKFGITLGDLVGNDPTLHPDYKKVVSLMGLPWYNVIGNHDLNFDVTQDSLSDESFERNFGPANFSFNYGNVHFIVLDDIYYPHPETGKGYQGGFRSSQLDFVQNDLKYVSKDKLVVLAYHIPLSHKKDEAFREADRNRLFQILGEYPNVLGLSAHTHYQRQNFYGKEDGWNGAKPFHEYNVGTTCGDWYSGPKDEEGIPVSMMRDGTPKGYALLNIDDNKYTFDYQVIGKPADYQISLYGASVIPEKYSKKYPLIANFFIGKKGDAVKVRIDGGKWVAMNYVQEVDPTYYQVVANYDMATSLVAGIHPSEPEKSSHLWKYYLPKLALGKHKIEITAKDMFGRTHKAEKEVEVVKEVN